MTYLQKQRNKYTLCNEYANKLAKEAIGMLGMTSTRLLPRYYKG